MARLALLTSGGDAPGMNPAIRAVVAAAADRGTEVVGVRHGFRGLHAGDADLLTSDAVDRITELGGTMLGSSRFPEMQNPAVVKEAATSFGELGADALLVIGGDGSIRGSKALGQAGVPVVHLPSTIDNDLAGTDITLGVDTCLNTILTLADSIRDTAVSMDRAIVVEIMGRFSGYLTLMAAVAAGAHAAIIPERPAPWEALRTRIKEAGRFNLIFCAEGAQPAQAVAERLADLYPTPPRVSVLGYIQRGGTPSFFDRMLGARLAEAAVEAALGGATGMMIAYRNGKCIPVPVAKAAGKRRQISPEVFELAKKMGVVYE